MKRDLSTMSYLRVVSVEMDLDLFLPGTMQMPRLVSSVCSRLPLKPPPLSPGMLSPLISSGLRQTDNQCVTVARKNKLSVARSQ